MFRVEFICDDRRLAAALRALVGIALAPGPTVHPLANATKTPKSVRAASTGNTIEMFAAWLKQSKLEEIRAPQVREFCRSAGMSERSYSHVLVCAREAGLLKRMGGGSTRSYYKVL